MAASGERRNTSESGEAPTHLSCRFFFGLQGASPRCLTPHRPHMQSTHSWQAAMRRKIAPFQIRKLLKISEEMQFPSSPQAHLKAVYEPEATRRPKMHAF